MMASQIALQVGAIATFMAKPFATRTGSGAHLHYHLADAATDDNLFLDPSDRRGLGLSQVAYHFIGGVLAHAPALCALTSPTVNCYKRLQMGPALLGSRSGYTWTPAFITYGDNNRTQMLRVPEGGHIEDRSVSSAFNPYLGMAAYLAAGLDGIARELDPGEPNLGNLYQSDPDTMRGRGIRTLPQSLPEALDHFANDAVVRESLGPIAGELIGLKRDEWREYHAQVDSWEIRRYLSAL
jgi:glutamine synthetase